MAQGGTSTNNGSNSSRCSSSKGARTLIAAAVGVVLVHACFYLFIVFKPLFKEEKLWLAGYFSLSNLPVEGLNSCTGLLWCSIFRHLTDFRYLPCILFPSVFPSLRRRLHPGALWLSLREDSKARLLHTMLLDLKRWVQCLMLACQQLHTHTRIQTCPTGVDLCAKTSTWSECYQWLKIAKRYITTTIRVKMTTTTLKRPERD